MRIHLSPGLLGTLLGTTVNIRPTPAFCASRSNAEIIESPACSNSDGAVSGENTYPSIRKIASAVAKHTVLPVASFAVAIKRLGLSACRFDLLGQVNKSRNSVHGIFAHLRTVALKLLRLMLISFTIHLRCQCVPFASDFQGCQACESLQETSHPIPVASQGTIRAIALQPGC